MEKKLSKKIIFYQSLRFIFILLIISIIFVLNKKAFTILAPVLVILEIIKIVYFYENYFKERVIKNFNLFIPPLDSIFIIFIILISNNIILIIALLLLSLVINFLLYGIETVTLEILISGIFFLVIGLVYSSMIIFPILAFSLIIIGLIMLFLNNKETKTESNTKDITDTENISNEIVDVKDEFTIIVSHNLRTPLAALRGYLQLIEYSNDEEIKKNYFNLLKSNVDKLHELIEEVLGSINLDKKSSNKDQKVNVNLVIGEIIERFNDDIKSKRIEIIVNSTSQLIESTINENRLKIIFSNILDNAIKYSHLNSKIDINISVIDENSITISIQDYGIGIDKSKIGEIFSKYNKSSNVLNSNFQGLGLGLYIVKSLVEIEKGTISVKSEQDKGTKVELVFPL
jgi:signal transduction histidine kinase